MNTMNTMNNIVKRFSDVSYKQISKLDGQMSVGSLGKLTTSGIKASVSKLLQLVSILKPKPDMGMSTKVASPVVVVSQAEVPKSFSGSVDSTRTLAGDTLKVRDQQLGIYHNALQTMLKECAGDSRKEGLIKAELTRVETQRNDEQLTPPNLDKLLSKDDLKEVLGSKHNLAGTTKAMTKLLGKLDPSTSRMVSDGLRNGARKVPLVGKMMVSKPEITKQAEALLSKAEVSHLSAQPSIQKIAEPGEGLTSIITPANESSTRALDGSGPALIRNTTMESHGTKLVTSQANKASVEGRAGNNQISVLMDAGKKVFSAVRHAITTTKSPSPSQVRLPDGSGRTVDDLAMPLQNKSAEEIKTALRPYISDEKKLDSLAKKLESGKSSEVKSATKQLAAAVSNRNKAIDVLRSALLIRLSEEGPKAGDMTHIQMNLSSVSLVTPDFFRDITGHGEKSMLLNQKEAFASLSSMTQEERTTLLSEFKNAVGTPLFPQDKMPTLGVEVSTFNFGVNEGEFLGRSTQGEQNKEAMTKLLAQASQKFQSLPQGSMEAKTLEKLIDTVQKEFTTYQSMGTLGRQLNPYRMPVLVLALSQECGGSPAFNCMSGKDRTGLLDGLAKRFMTALKSAVSSENMETVGKALTLFDAPENTFKKLDSSMGVLRPNLIAKYGGTEGIEAEFKNNPEGVKAELQTAGVTLEDFMELRQFQLDNKSMMRHSGNLEVQEENTGKRGYKAEGISWAGSHRTENNFAMLFGVDPKNTTDVTGLSSFTGA